MDLNIEATEKLSGFNIEAKLPIGISYLTFGFNMEATEKLSGFNIEAKLLIGVSYLTCVQLLDSSTMLFKKSI
jgi:hypothetical protein